MTEKAFYEIVAQCETIDESARDYAKARLEKMENDPHRKENAELAEKILELLKNAEEPMTSPDVAAKIGISTQRANGILRQVVAAGIVGVSDNPIVSGKRVLKGYVAIS